MVSIGLSPMDSFWSHLMWLFCIPHYWSPLPSWNTLLLGFLWFQTLQVFLLALRSSFLDGLFSSSQTLYVGISLVTVLGLFSSLSALPSRHQKPSMYQTLSSSSLFQPLSHPGSHFHAFSAILLEYHPDILKWTCSKWNLWFSSRYTFLSSFSSSINDQLLMSETWELFLIPPLLHCSY